MVPNLDEKGNPKPLLHEVCHNYYCSSLIAKTLLEKDVKDEKDKEGINLNDLLMKYPIE